MSWHPLAPNAILRYTSVDNARTIELETTDA